MLAMRFLLAFFCLALALLPAQSLTLTGPASVRPGEEIEITLSHDVTGAAGVQWDAAYPAGWLALPQIGAAATAAGKTLYCTDDATRCLVVGMTADVIAPGALAVIRLGVPLTTPPGSASVTLSKAMAGDAHGAPITVSAGAPYTVTVLPRREDLNGDGKVDATDLGLLLDQVTGKTAAGNADLNGDGDVNLIDALLLIRAALGL